MFLNLDGDHVWEYYGWEVTLVLLMKRLCLHWRKLSYDMCWWLRFGVCDMISRPGVPKFLVK